MNGIRLTILRSYLFFNVPEAATFIAGVTTRMWRYWESGEVKIPDHVTEKIDSLLEYRARRIAEYRSIPKITLVYYSNIADWRRESKSEDIYWRPECSVIAELAASGWLVEEFNGEDNGSN